MKPTDSLENGLQDIVIGLVAPIGIDLDPLCRVLSGSFERLGYSPHEVRLSALLDEVRVSFGLDLNFTNEKERYERFMTAGNRFRASLGRGDALSMLAVGAMR